MRVHHLNCGTMCPYGAQLVLGHPELPGQHLVCHCLLIETNAGLVLVDTGFAARDRDPKTTTLPKPFLLTARPIFPANETAKEQITALGFSPSDVKHIILTHMDPDHAGGLHDFPDASVHVGAVELEAARKRRDASERRRYHAAQWAHVARFVEYSPTGEPWKGFACVRGLLGLPPEILLVSLAGHTRGHMGVAVEGETGWMLHAGDAYFYDGEMAVDGYRCPRSLRLFQRFMVWNNGERVATQGRLRELVKSEGNALRVFSAHDQVELARAQEVSRLRTA